MDSSSPTSTSSSFSSLSLSFSMAIFFHGGCLPLLLCITILLSFSTFPSTFSSFLPHQRHLLQSNSPQNIETFFPTFSVPALPSQTPPPTSHPPSLNPPTSPNLSPTPSPPPTTSSSRAVAKAVAATAAGTLVFAGLFFFFLQRCALARRHRHKMEKTTQVISSPRRDEETAVSYDAFKLMNGTLKGLVVDENGLDVLYWRKLEGRGGDGRKVFKKEVLDREPRREKRSAGGRVAGLDRPRREKRDGLGRAGAVSHANSDPITRIPSNSSSAASSQISPYELQFPDLLRSPPQRIAAAVGAEAFSTLKTENPPPPPSPPLVLVKEVSDTPPALPTPESKNRAPPPPPPPPLPVKKNPAPPPPPPPPPPVKKNPGAPPPPPPPLPGRKNLAPPPLPPRPGSLRPSSSRGRVGSGGGGGGGGSKKMAEAVASSSASKETEVGPQTKLKPLHWDKLTASSEHSMVWDKIGNGSFQ